MSKIPSASSASAAAAAGRFGPGRLPAADGDHQVLAHVEVVEELGALPGPGEPAVRPLVRREPVRVVPVELDPPAAGHEAGAALAQADPPTFDGSDCVHCSPCRGGP